MKICDRCGCAAVDKVCFFDTDEWFDLCGSCRDDVRSLILQQKVSEPKEKKEKRRETIRLRAKELN